MNRIELVNLLKKNRKMIEQMEVDTFEKVIWEVADLQSEDDLMLPLLLEVLDDECQHKEVMWTLFQRIEYYAEVDLDYFVETVVKQTPYILNNASQWIRHLYLNFVYNTEEREILKMTLAQMPAEIASIIASYILSLPKQAFNTDISLNIAEVIAVTKK